MTPLRSPSPGNLSTHMVEGWIVSLLLHSTAVLLGILLMTTVRLAPQPEPFQWDVSVIQSQMAEPITQPLSPSVDPTPSSEPVTAAPLESPSPDPVVQQQVAMPVESAPAIMERPVQQTAAVQPTPVPAATVPQPAQALESMPPPVTRESSTVATPQPAPVHSPTLVEASPRTPVVEAATTVSVAPITPPAPAESQPIPRPTPEPPVPQMDPKPIVEAPLSRAEGTAAEEAPRQFAAVPAVAAPPAPPSKPDRGWLSELLFKRVEQLKRYPALARVDRLEGKVIVKAMLHENGQLSDVEVVKSSGHDLLDQAAVEVLQEVSPLQLPRPLGKPAVPIKVPISYGLIDGLNSTK